MTVSVSKAVTPAELTDIRPLVLAHVEFEGSDAVLPAGWPEKIAQLVADERLVIFTAREGRQAVGYASMTTDVATWTGDSFAHLDCVFVEEGSRGAGIGRLLLDAALRDARSRGLSELQWQTPEWNAPAIRFYERLGAMHTAKERFTFAL